MRRNPRAGFTLIEVLLAVSLLALLASLLGGVLTSSRRAVMSTGAAIDRLRSKVLMGELLQQQLDLSLSKFSFEAAFGRIRGFSFVAYERLGGRQLKVRSRYVFEPDPERATSAFRLIRYAIADGIGVDESKEILLEDVREPVIEAFSGAAEEFLPAEEVPGISNLLRIRYKLPRKTRDDGDAPLDEYSLMLNNGYVEPNEPR